MPAARRVVWAPKAEQDLLDIWRYYAHVASPDLADDHLRAIKRAGEHLSKQSLMWRRRDEVAPGLRSVRVHPHTIFYRIKGDVVEIARVLHERRNFPALFPRENGQ
jgi:toxin ParE1/3/4